MNTTMADGASERLDAQIADALFGQPGMSKLDVANRLRQLRGDGGALLGSAAYPAAWMWPHPEDGSVRFTCDGDVASEAASMGRAVSALYRVPVQEGCQPSPAGQGDALDLDRVLSLADVHAEESREDGMRLLDRGGLLAFAQDVGAALAARQPVASNQPSGNSGQLGVDGKAAALKDSLTVGGGQEPVAVVTTSDRFTYGKLNRDLPDGTHLYAAPPAQSVGQEPVAPKKMARAVALDLMHAVYEHHGWKRAEGESMTARVHALYDVTMDAGRNRFVATPKPAAPPAQAVDLGQFRSLARSWIVEAGGTVADTKHACADELLALIDSQAVGNG